MSYAYEFINQSHKFIPNGSIVQRKMFQKFFFVCFLCYVISKASATCRFSGSMDWYVCHLENVVATSSSDAIDLSGIHIGGLTNADVTELIVAPSSRIEEIPSIIFPTFVSLEIIQIGVNHLRRIELTNCGPSMAALYVNGNSIPVLQSGAFRGCSTLQLLRLTDNSINIIEEDAFEGLSNLRVLFLNNNQFTSLPQELLRPLIRIETLELQGNSELSSVHGDAFQTMANIFRIDLRSNNLEVISAGTFANKAELFLVNLSINRIRTIEANAFAHLPRLQTLNIGSNDIAVINSDIFGSSLPNLQIFWLSHNVINAFDQNTFAVMPGLSSFSVWGNICASRDFDLIGSVEVNVFPYMQVCFENFLQLSK